jgi:prepilin-type N-terminal cleavage/methylation domain-containing protein
MLMHATSQKQIARYGRDQLTGRSARTSGFSLTELLVVIAIIVLLIGLLLAALAQVRKKTLKTQTEATMQQFANACTVFQTEHGFYPGVIPDAVIAAAYPAAAPPISSTENALLHLMGGYRVLGPNDTNPDSFIYKDYYAYSTSSFEEIEFDAGVPLGLWKLRIKTIPADNNTEVAQLGEGPFINGKPYPPYFTPDKNSLVRLRNGQLGEPQEGLIPDLVDSWGQPIIYIRQTRDRGPLVKDPAALTSLPQFELAGLEPYLQSQGIGEKGADQTFNGGNTGGSILGIGSSYWEKTDLQRKLASVILNNQSFYKATPAATGPFYGKARGAIMLLSAGPDGVFFSALDGPGSSSTPIDAGMVNSDIIGIGPRVLDEFDDIRIYAGG